MRLSDEELKRRLKKIMEEYVAEVLGCQYKQVHVLLLKWADDDLGVADELKQLKGFFYNKYCFNVDTFDIPSEYPYDALEWRLADFKSNYSIPENLLIVYYGGHWYFDGQNRLLWSAN
jgi:hypothetical protein